MKTLLTFGSFNPRYNGSETNYQGDESNDAASNCSFDGIEMAAPFRARQYSNILEEEEKEAGGRDKVDSKESEKPDSSITDQSDHSGSVTRYGILLNDNSYIYFMCLIGCQKTHRILWSPPHQHL